MYQEQLSKRNIIQYLGVGVFVLGVVWGTLHTIDWLGKQVAPPVTVSEEVIPDFLQLKSQPQDVLYAETYETPRGSEVKYAYMAGEPEVEANEDVTRRTPNSRTKVLAVEVEGNKRTETLKTSFYAAPQFYEDNGQWRQIEYATTTPEIFAASGAVKYVERRLWWERILPGKPLFAATDTFRPDPDVETTSVDGQVQNSGSFTTWATVRGATAGNSVNDNGTPGAVLNSFNSPAYVLSRVFLLFDTSAFDDLTDIDSATLWVSIVSVGNPDNDGNDLLGLFTSTPASNTALVTGDFDQVGGTLLATAVDMTGLSGSHTFTLNATGISNISKTGVSKFSLRLGYDYLNHDPVGSSSVTVSLADTAGTSSDPRLEITYTVDSFSFGQWFPF